MKFWIVVTCIAAFYSFMKVLGAVLRWGALRGRPVLTPGELADVPPGTAVVVVGRTAAGPVFTASLSGEPCVAQKTDVVTSHYVNDNNTETQRREGFPSGDLCVYGADGSIVQPSAEVRTRKLLLVSSAMMYRVAHVEAPENTMHDERSTQEFIVPPDQPVVAAGVVTTVDGDSTRLVLEGSDWGDGSALCDIKSITGLFIVDIVMRSCLTLALAGTAILLIRADG